MTTADTVLRPDTDPAELGFDADRLERIDRSFADARVYLRGSAQKPLTVPLAEPVRIWHLMTHTSGLTYGFHHTHAVDEIYRAAGFEWSTPPGMDLAACCDAWAAMPLAFQPGAEWLYSMATDVLGRLVEVVSGQALDAFFAERILGPLGMVDTAFWTPPEKHSRLAVLCMPDPGTGRPVRSPGDARGRERPVCLSGGGGLVSTASDYHR